MPFELALRSGRAYHFVCARKRQGRPNAQAFRAWLKQEVAALDWGKCVKAPALILDRRSR
jgi:LysR family glycine cleavage system transcriptional activator